VVVGGEFPIVLANRVGKLMKTYQTNQQIILYLQVLFSESVPVLFFITAAFCSKGLTETIGDSHTAETFEKKSR
jgi:hypothetical protein